MNHNTIQIYSIFSGTFYEVPKEDFKLLDMGQIPLLKKPSGCKKCNGRCHIGRNAESYGYFICKCLHKVIDHSIIKNAQEVTVS
jgi:uncharacterized Fe-S radical SAM superfamily protein PflX